MSTRSKLRLPKEHGAWAMLFVPMAVGFCIARTFNIASLLFVVSATLFFISRESLIVWLRARARGKDGSDSRNAWLVYIIASAAFGAPLLAYYRLFVLVPIGAIGIVLAIINAVQPKPLGQRTTLGESLAIAGLTMTAPAALYVSTGEWSSLAWLLWLLCAIYFASSIYYVKLRVAAVHAKNMIERDFAWRRCAVYHFALLGLLVSMAAIGNVRWLAIAAFGPVLFRSFAELAKPSSRLNLKRAGFLEVFYSLVFLVFITLTFR